MKHLFLLCTLLLTSFLALGIEEELIDDFENPYLQDLVECPEKELTIFLKYTSCHQTTIRQAVVFDMSKHGHLMWRHELNIDLSDNENDLLLLERPGVFIGLTKEDLEQNPYINFEAQIDGEVITINPKNLTRKELDLNYSLKEQNLIMNKVCQKFTNVKSLNKNYTDGSLIAEGGLPAREIEGLEASQEFKLIFCEDFDEREVKNFDRLENFDDFIKATFFL